MKPLFKQRKAEPFLGSATAAVFLLAIFLVSCCAALLEWDARGNLIAHSYSVWGDWSAHFTFIENLRQRGLHWLAGDNPVFAGAPFQYPFLSHLITAAYGGILGLSTLNATESLSLALLFVAPWLLFRLFRQFGLQPIAGFVSTAVFFLAGGFQWMGLFNPSELNEREPLTNHFDNASVFTQFVAFEFYPQRAFLFGLVLLAGVGYFALRRWRENRLTRPATIGSAIGLGLLALTHVHSFLALAAFLIMLFVFRRDRKIFLFSAAVAALGCSIVAFLLLHDRRPDLALAWEYWAPGWAMSSVANLRVAREMNPISFWLLNTGLYLPLAGAGAWFAWHERERYPLAREWACAGLFLFLLANFINLQPYWYDNLKTFTYAFFFLAPLIGVFFERVLFTRKVLYPVAAVLLVAQSYAGAADLWSLRGHLQNTTFFSATEFALAEDFKRMRQSPDDLVVFTPRHNHWVTCLAGNPTLMGFPGWLWSWGISYGPREQEMNEILLGGPRAADLIAKYDVRYVAIQAGEQAGGKPVAIDYFRSRYSKIAARDAWEIFAVKAPSSSVR